MSHAPTRDSRKLASAGLIEQCCCICRRLAQFGERAVRDGFGVAPFAERHRNIHNFARRESRLPEQRDRDTVDYRSLLHRDGSVLSAVSLQVLLSKIFSAIDLVNSHTAKQILRIVLQAWGSNLEKMHGNSASS